MEARTRVIKVTTEGDCEGHSTREVGLFTGELNQIVTHLLNIGEKPYYNFKVENVWITDCSLVCPDVVVTYDRWGKITYETKEQSEVRLAKEKALAKLSPEERELLGLN